MKDQNDTYSPDDGSLDELLKQFLLENPDDPANAAAIDAAAAELFEQPPLLEPDPVKGQQLVEQLQGQFGGGDTAVAGGGQGISSFWKALLIIGGATGALLLMILWNPFETTNAGNENNTWLTAQVPTAFGSNNYTSIPDDLIEPSELTPNYVASDSEPVQPEGFIVDNSVDLSSMDALRSGVLRSEMTLKQSSIGDVAAWQGKIPLNKLSDALAAFMQEYPEERIHVHTDRHVYRPGETLWFTAYLRNGKDLTPSVVSGVVKLQLVSPKGSVIHELNLITKNGITQGDIEFKKELPGGTYKIRALTQWQQNERHAYTFEKEIKLTHENINLLNIDAVLASPTMEKDGLVNARLELKDQNNLPVSDKDFTYRVNLGDGNYIEIDDITNNAGVADIEFVLPEELRGKKDAFDLEVEVDGNKQTVPNRKRLYENQINLEFYPEGGDLVNGLQSKVAFAAVNIYGDPVDASGAIYDAHNQLVTYFNSYHNGTGVFEMLPAEGNQYYAVIDYPVKTDVKYNLPIALSDGQVLRVTQKNKEQLGVTIHSTEEKELELIAQVRGELYHRVRFKVRPGSQTLSIDMDKFPIGTAHLTLFTGKGIELAERLVFVNRDQQLNIEINTDKDEYLPREEVTARIKVNDHFGNPIKANLSVAVIDQQIFNFSDDKTGTIQSKLLLEPDVRGAVENGGFYFDESNLKAEKALDLLLMTRGWRRFSWKEMTKDKLVKAATPAEKGRLNILIIDAETQQPLEKVKVKVTEQLGRYASDENGRLVIDDLDLTEIKELELFYKGARMYFLVNSYAENLIIPFEGGGGTYHQPIAIDKESPVIKVINRIQGDSTVVAGRVVDVYGQGVASANIIAKEFGKIISGTTADENGYYLLRLDHSGLYDLIVKAEEYTTHRAQDIKVKHGNAVLLDILMSGSTPIENNSLLGTANLSQRETPYSYYILMGDEDFSLDTRSFSSIFPEVPGIYHIGDYAPKHRSVSYNAMSYYIDGIQLKHNQPVTIPLGSFETIQIYNGSQPVRYDGIGGVVNMETRSGIDDFTSGFDYAESNRKPYSIPENFTSNYYRARTYPEINHVSKLKLTERNDFRATAYWSGMVTTDSTGKGSFTFTNTDNITRFSIIAEGMTDGGDLGRGVGVCTTKLPFDMKVAIAPGTEDGFKNVAITITNHNKRAILGEWEFGLPLNWSMVEALPNKSTVGATREVTFQFYFREEESAEAKGSFKVAFSALGYKDQYLVELGKEE